ncbi:MAG: hypothetical protein ABIZ91_00190 [Gemmatimonadaceae bacterium]
MATLLIDAEWNLPGRIDASTGSISFDDPDEAQVDDVLDDLGELVLKRGGDVVVVPGDQMPTTTGIAAIYRF